MERIVGIAEAASVLGVSITMLRRWEASGKLVAEHTARGHRRYDLSKLRPELFRAAGETRASLQTDTATGNFYQPVSDVVFVDFEA
jgi:hypothetical protein